MESCQGHKRPNFNSVSSQNCKFNLSNSGKNMFFLDKEMPTLQALVCTLQKSKEESQKDLEKMQGQIEGCMLLLTLGEEELFEFQAIVDAQNTKILDLWSQGKPTKDIGATLIELEPLQWKLDSQISIVEAFKKLLEKR